MVLGGWAFSYERGTPVRIVLLTVPRVGRSYELFRCEARRLFVSLNSRLKGLLVGPVTRVIKRKKKKKLWCGEVRINEIPILLSHFANNPCTSKYPSLTHRSGDGSTGLLTPEVQGLQGYLAHKKLPPPP